MSRKLCLTFFCCNIIALLLVVIAGCKGGENDQFTESNGEETNADGSRWQPNISDTWQWQLNSPVNTTYQVKVYDIDLVENSAEQISTLHDSGHKVICYFSAGSYENWRPDIADFNEADLGQTLDGWPDERWLDIRSSNVREIMQIRLDQAAQKGCDGVEPDNIDGYLQNTGFPLSAEDQLDYNRFLAREAHRRNLAIALKNDIEQVADLLNDFDFAINEQCHEYAECDSLEPFINAGKPVFNAEYADNFLSDATARRALCADALNREFRALVLPLDLDDSFRYSCDDPDDGDSDSHEDETGWPDAANTGIPIDAPALTRINGAQHTTTEGQVIDAVELQGRLYIDHQHVTIKRSHLIGDEYYAVYCTISPVYLTIQDCEITSGLNIADNTTLLRNNIYCPAGGKKDDGIVFNASNILFQDNYIHDLDAHTGAHVDGIQVMGGSNIVIRHNWVDPSSPPASGGLMNAAIYFMPDLAPISNVTVEGNAILGGGTWYPLRLYDVTGTVNVSGNRWVDRNFLGEPALLVDTTPTVWTDNAYEDNGQAVSP